jgi:hypothetical protein
MLVDFGAEASTGVGLPPELDPPLDPPLLPPLDPPPLLLLPGGTGTTLPSGRTSTVPPSGSTSMVPPLLEPPLLPVPTLEPAVRSGSSSDAPPHPTATTRTTPAAPT